LRKKYRATLFCCVKTLALRYVALRCVTQRESFYATEKCCTALFTRNRRRRNGKGQANRNDFYFFRNAEVDQLQLRLPSTNDCGIAERRGSLREKSTQAVAEAPERCGSCGTAAA